MRCAKLLPDVELGDVQQYKGAAIIPVYGNDVFTSPHYSLDDALGKGGFSATDSGKVNRVIIDNGLDKQVFVAAGMILEGASQNRAAKYPALVAMQNGVALPVYCAQKGQGTQEGSPYKTSSTILMPSARTGTVDQNRTWANITRLMQTTHIASPTQDYTQMVSNDNGSSSESNQIGYLAAVGKAGQFFFYADIFGHQEMYKGLHDRLLNGVGAAAQAMAVHETSIGKDGFAKFLKASRQLEFSRTSHEHIGDVYRLHGIVEGNALTSENNRVQVSLRQDVSFPAGSIMQTMIFTRN